MVNIFKKMTPEEAIKSQIFGFKFIFLPLVIIFTFIFFSSPFQKLIHEDSNSNDQQESVFNTFCPVTLHQCGSGCIPSNAVCCDKTQGNSYCLSPNTLCKANSVTNGEKDRFLCSEDEKVKSYDCSAGQVFCGMFCINVGEKCCFGGVCDEDKTVQQPNTIAKPKLVPKTSCPENSHQNQSNTNECDCNVGYKTNLSGNECEIIPTPASTQTTSAAKKNSSKCNPVNECGDYVNHPDWPKPLEVYREVDCACPSGTMDVGVGPTISEINGKYITGEARICTCYDNF